MLELTVLIIRLLGRYKHAEWKIQESKFDSLHELANLLFLIRVQMDSGTQPSSHSMGAENNLTRSQAAQV
jgi:hypothetical protein